MTTESGENGAKTLSRMNFSGYVIRTTACCLVVGLGLGCSVWLVNGIKHVLILLCVVVVTLPGRGRAT